MDRVHYYIISSPKRECLCKPYWLVLNRFAISVIKSEQALSREPLWSFEILQYLFFSFIHFTAGKKRGSHQIPQSSVSPSLTLPHTLWFLPLSHSFSQKCSNMFHPNYIFFLVFFILCFIKTGKCHALATKVWGNSLFFQGLLEMI